MGWNPLPQGYWLSSQQLGGNRKMEKLKIGVSSCLLGQQVRYNGDHKYNQIVIDLFDLDDRFEAVPVCPEVEMGMGIPREKVQIVEGVGRMAGESSNLNQKLPLSISKLPPRVVARMVGVESGKDWTDVMTDFSSKKLEELSDLCGFIFKTRSPSCGTQAVPVYPATGETTAGLFARAFMKRFPDIPVIDEEQLQDEQARENFIAATSRGGN